VRLAVHHVTTYQYTSAAWDSFNEVRLRPADDYRQTLLSFEVTITPHTPLRSHLDYFGNVAHHFHLANEHEALTIETDSVVITYPVPNPSPVPATALPDLRHRFFEYLAPTRRVPLDRDWFPVFGANRVANGDDLTEYLFDLTEHLHDRFTYQSGATHVDTTIEEFARTHAGVCQDYTHAMLALCRSTGIPARYVSGYVHPHPDDESSLLGAEGSHAWLEAFLPGNGWVGFDPTNGCPVGEAHVKVAVGRDYDDVAPVRGLRRGGSDSVLSVEVRVRSATEQEPGEFAPVR